MSTWLIYGSLMLSDDLCTTARILSCDGLMAPDASPMCTFGVRLYSSGVRIVVLCSIGVLNVLLCVPVVALCVPMIILYTLLVFLCCTMVFRCLPMLCLRCSIVCSCIPLVSLLV